MHDFWFDLGMLGVGIVGLFALIPRFHPRTKTLAALTTLAALSLTALNFYLKAYTGVGLEDRFICYVLPQGPACAKWFDVPSLPVLDAEPTAPAGERRDVPSLPAPGAEPAGERVGVPSHEPAPYQQTPKLEDMRRPIDQLYEAWKELNFDKYSAQWDPGAIYYDVRLGKSLSCQEFLEKRRRDFGGRFVHVTVDEYQATFVRLENHVAEFQVYYRMGFRTTEGRTIREAERESYKTKLDPASGQWRIIENRDYIQSK